MTQKIEINVDQLYGLVYTWTKHVGIQRIPEDMDKKSFERGAFVFLEKLRGLIPEKEEEGE